MFITFRNNSADCRIKLNINDTSYLLESGKSVEVNVYEGADHDLGKDDAAKERANELLFGYIDRFLK